jgi:hypothetical protein
MPVLYSHAKLGNHTQTPLITHENLVLSDQANQSRAWTPFILGKTWATNGKIKTSL